jgi:hypothetical protein
MIEESEKGLPKRLTRGWTRGPDDRGDTGETIWTACRHLLNRRESHTETQ